ncbi:MAG: hypothetical protein EB060_08235 [Proteobacteria bacterium]|nr:hypothetical protein [Pseudomonadota bacterium]
MKLTDTQADEFYNTILKLYDMAEGVIDVVEQEHTTNKDVQIDLAEPVVEQVGESAIALCESFSNFVKSGNKPSPTDVRNFEAALRKIFGVVLQFKEKVKDMPKLVA